MSSINNKKIFVFTILMLFVISFLSLLNRVLYVDKENYKISIIVNKEEDEYNSLVKEGINLATYELLLEVKYIYATELYPIDYHIKNEIKKGVDGVVVLSSFKENIILEDNIKTPIIILGENTKIKPYISYINSNSFKMGSFIGDEIIKNGNTRKTIILLKDKKNIKNELEMCKGVKNSLKLSYNKIEEIYYDSNKLYDLMKNNANKVFVTFNPYILEDLCKIKLNNKKFFQNTELYGFSRGNNRIKYLDDDICKAIVVQNEFSLGYLGILEMKNILNKDIYSNDEINFSIVNKMNMYKKENQYLLFPFK